MEAPKGITVYCASSDHIPKEYFESAYELGRKIADCGLPVINGGGHMGLMRAVSDGALDAGGEAYGVIPQFMVDAGRCYSRLTKVYVTTTMSERKTLLADLSVGVIALPGGVGTFEEITEVMTKRKLGLYKGEAVILNINNYYDDFIRLLMRSESEGFSHGARSWTQCLTPDEAINHILSSL